MSPGDDHREDAGRSRADRAAVFAAWSVHVFTACGAGAGLLALERAVAGAYPAMFGWLAVALLIDGVDGTLARAAKVREHARAIDGETLDLVVDFLTYVVVPAAAIWNAHMMPPVLGAPVLLCVGVASAVYFADRRMKTADHWFRGFPALWNVAALYLFAFTLPGVMVAAVLLGLCALMFAPLVFVHPMRVTRLRTVTYGVATLWAVCATLVVWENFSGPLLARIGLLLAGVYFLALPFTRSGGLFAGPEGKR